MDELIRLGRATFSHEGTRGEKGSATLGFAHGKGTSDSGNDVDLGYICDTVCGIFRPTFTVDGFVRIWTLNQGKAENKVTLAWFSPPGARERAELTRAVELLLTTFCPGRGQALAFAAFEPR